jgi:hypothetical protein
MRVLIRLTAPAVGIMARSEENTPALVGLFLAALSDAAVALASHS